MHNVAPGVLITQGFLLSTDPLMGPQAPAYGPTNTQTHMEPMWHDISSSDAGAILHNPRLCLSPYPTVDDREVTCSRAGTQHRTSGATSSECIRCVQCLNLKWHRRGKYWQYPRNKIKLKKKQKKNLSGSLRAHTSKSKTLTIFASLAAVLSSYTTETTPSPTSACRVLQRCCCLYSVCVRWGRGSTVVLNSLPSSPNCAEFSQYKIFRSVNEMVNSTKRINFCYHKEWRYNYITESSN